MNKKLNRSSFYFSLLILGLATATILSCGEESTPSAPTVPDGTSRFLTQRIDTADITFYFAEGDSVNTAYQQAFHEWAVPYLGVSMPRRLRYFKYFDNAHMLELTGQTYGSWADIERYAIHSVERQQGHEAIHVYSYVLGWPTDFFTEGIACALDINPFTGEEVPFFGDTVHNLSRNWLAQGTLYPLQDLLDEDGFRSGQWRQTYPQAGSFTQFLIAEFGLETLKEIFRTIDEYDSTETVLAGFETVYGIPLEEAERRWHDFLRGS